MTTLRKIKIKINNLKQLVRLSLKQKYFGLNSKRYNNFVSITNKNCKKSKGRI